MGTFVDIFFAVRLLLALIRMLAYALGTLDVPAWVLDAPLSVAGILFSAAIGHLVVEYAVKPLISWLKRTFSRGHGPEGLEDNSEEVGRLQREVGRLQGAESVLREELERERREKGRLEAELREARRPWWRRVSGR